MDLKQEIVSINTENLLWEQERIKHICKNLKGYSDTCEKLEVALIHIGKNELELAKKIILELKSSKGLDNFVKEDVKTPFFKMIILPFTMIIRKFSKK